MYDIYHCLRYAVITLKCIQGMLIKLKYCHDKISYLWIIYVRACAPHTQTQLTDIYLHSYICTHTKTHTPSTVGPQLSKHLYATSMSKV